MRRFEQIHSGIFTFAKDVVKGLSLSRPRFAGLSSGTEINAYQYKVYVDFLPQKLVIAPVSGLQRITSAPATLDVRINNYSVGTVTLSAVSLVYDCAVADYTSTVPITASDVTLVGSFGVALNPIAIAAGVLTTNPTLTLTSASKLVLPHGSAAVPTAAWLSGSTITVTTEVPLVTAGLSVTRVSGAGTLTGSLTVAGRRITTAVSGLNTSIPYVVQVTGTSVYGVGYSRTFHVQISPPSSSIYIPDALPLPGVFTYVRGVSCVFGQSVQIALTSAISSAQVSLRVTTDIGITTTSVVASPHGTDSYTLVVPLAATQGRIAIRIDSITAPPGVVLLSIGTWVEAIPTASPILRDFLDITPTALPDVFRTNALVTSPTSHGYMYVPRVIPYQPSSTPFYGWSWTNVTFRTYSTSSATPKILKSDGTVTSLPTYTYVSSTTPLGVSTVACSNEFIIGTVITASSSTVTAVRSEYDMGLIPPELLYYPQEA